jgi:ATP-dependent DNA helicase RecQ
VEEAYGILLGGSEDDRISDYFIANAFPPEAHVAMILDALDGAPNGLRDIELHSSLNITKSQIDKALKILGAEDPAPVIKDGTRWVRTPAQWAPDTKRIQQLTALRQAEQQEIAAYMRSTECLMLQLALSLDDPHARRCGKCANCIGRPLINTDVNTDFTRDAENFLKRSFLTFEPRKKWPDSNAFPDYGFHGFIPMELRAATGRALCLWGDPGWGALVHDGKYQTGRFDDALVDACVSMLRANPFPIAPKWVTCVPSLTRPDLIPDFANRLAAKLNLPFSAAVTKAASNEPQKTMMNSWQQAHNLDGAFRILLEKLHAGPVLLIDDMVDSRWTMTVIAARLRLAAQKKGLDCPAVLPLALALNSLHAN